MKILISILVFGVIIAIHEFGHFSVAKLCGIKVNQFAIGMGPPIFKKQWGETEYSLRVLPIGGYCSMEGEDASSSDSRAFGNKPVIKRMAVVVAGAIMNIILGFILILITTCMSDKIATTTISQFHKNDSGEIVASSYESGLREGDKIVKINNLTVFNDADVAYKLQTTDENSFTVTVKRNGEKITLNNVVFEDTATTGRLDFYVEPQNKTFFSVISYSARDLVTTARMIWISLIDLVSGKYGFHDLSGPVGIVGAIGEASGLGIEYLLNLVTFITVNVGIFNLLPLPALDGGRFVFLVIEAIRKKKISPEKEGMIHFIGLALLMCMMLLVTINDVRNLF